MDVAEAMLVSMRSQACDLVANVSASTNGATLAVVPMSRNATGGCVYHLGHATNQSSLELNVLIRMVDAYFGMSSVVIVAQSMQGQSGSTSESVDEV